jgi:antitoxin CptB
VRNSTKRSALAAVFLMPADDVEVVLNRRGLLENDLLLTRFLDQHEETLTDEEVEAFSILLELPDNELLNLLLARSEPEGEADVPQVHALLIRLRAI